MARIASGSDFVLPIEGLGNFTFATRRMSDEIAIQVEYAKLIDGAPETDWLRTVCGWISVLRVLTVRAPAGWDIDDLDPGDDASYAKLGRVHAALVSREGSFRRRSQNVGEAGGPGAGSDGSVVVPQAVQPSGN